MECGGNNIQGVEKHETKKKKKKFVYYDKVMKAMGLTKEDLKNGSK